MNNNLKIAVLGICGMAVCFAPAIEAQSAAIDSLRMRLVNSGVPCLVRIDGLHATTNLAGRPSEIRVVNGLINRGFSGLVHGQYDIPIRAGQPVRVFSVEAISQAKEDALRLVLAAAGTTIPVSFAVPRGSLMSMTEEQLTALVDPVLLIPRARVAPIPPAPQAEVARTVPKPSPDMAGPIPNRVPKMPPHPAATVVDLKPAAPGYPAMHASGAAKEGCWWAPYVSARWNVEFALLDCETEGWKVAGIDTPHGIALKSAGSDAAPEEIITVHTKRADQPVEAAIQQQFIAKLDSPGARASCHAQCRTEGDGLVLCDVVATGAYAKQKRFQAVDHPADEDPCPGLNTNDAIANFFLYRPLESKTKILFFSGDDLLSTMDSNTVHFLPEL